MIEKMSDEYKGKTTKSCGYTISNPRNWTKEELNWVNMLIEKGCTNKEIAESTDRSLTSVAIKVKRLSKKNGTYNITHIEEKYKTNNDFLDIIKPNSVLDVFCGEKNFYKNYNVTSNDINKNIECKYHLDSYKLCCKLYIENQKFDLIDLDPYGSAFDCFDLAIKMAQKGIIITFGELGHKRWKRLDFVSRYYGINKIEDFTLENLINQVQIIGKRNKKNLIPIFIREWKNTGRAWFKIEPLKITEQWNKEKEKASD